MKNSSRHSNFKFQSYFQCSYPLFQKGGGKHRNHVTTCEKKKKRIFQMDVTARATRSACDPLTGIGPRYPLRSIPPEDGVHTWVILFLGDYITTKVCFLGDSSYDRSAPVVVFLKHILFLAATQAVNRDTIYKPSPSRTLSCHSLSTTPHLPTSWVPP